MPSKNSSGNKRCDLPLDLSYKPKECKPIPPNPILLKEVISSFNSHDQLGLKSEDDLTIKRPMLSGSSAALWEAKDSKSRETFSSENARIESRTVSLYDTDSEPETSTVHAENVSANSCHLSMNDGRAPPPTGHPPISRKNRERTLLPCQVCSKAFDRPSLLKRHIRTHTGEKPHVCDVCAKGFSTSSSLNTHRRIHSGEKPHQCPTCGKRFTASSNLYYHRMTHIKEKPHKCTICHKSFPTPGDLKSHTYVHNGSWPFQCPVCKRGFSKQTNLRNHLFLHTGKKPHSCSHCGKCFALACNLRAHVRIHSEPNSCQLDINADPTGNYPATQDNINGNPNYSPSTRQKQGEEPRPIPHLASHLVDHVFFWQTIQQRLTTNLLVQQHQQNQIEPLHFTKASSP